MTICIYVAFLYTYNTTQFVIASETMKYLLPNITKVKSLFPENYKILREELEDVTKK